MPESASVSAVASKQLDAPPPLQPLTGPPALMQLGMGFMTSRTFLTAVEFGLFTTLAASPTRGKMTLPQIEKALGLHPRSSRDFLDALVALRLLEREDDKDGEAWYSNTETSSIYLDRNKESYIGGLFEMVSHRLFKLWNALPLALRTGQPQNELVEGGPDQFKVLYADQRRLEAFLRAMTGLSSKANRAIAKAVDCSKYKSFLDAGCAQGDFVVAMTLAHPHLHGIGVDLPEVEPIFTRYVSERGVAQKTEFKAVDFFKSPLPKADLVFMGHILHDWSLAEKKHLVKAAFEALPKGGAFVVYEEFIDDERRESVPGLIMSLNMLIETQAGFDYSARDATEWLNEAGFSSVRVERFEGNQAAIVAIK